MKVEIPPFSVFGNVTGSHVVCLEVRVCLFL